ncbi:MAG: helicase, partial [Aphanizomenon sp.]
MQISFLDQASLWGQVFEIAVKRGVLQKLIHEKLLINNHPIVQHWQNFKNAAIKNHLIKSLKLTKDENSQAWVESMVRHLLVLGYGLGWTTMRECLKQTPVSKLKLEAIWCPLVFPGEVQKPDIEPEKTAQEFKQAFNLTGNPDLGLVEKGKPARADFLLWLSPDENSTTKKRDHFIFCFEFSYNVPSKLADFSHENAHREEV